MPDAPNGGDSAYRMLFENAGDAIFVHNENKILAVNKKACETLAYAEDELLSLKPNEVDASEQRMYMPERMAKLKNHKTITFETTHQKRDGTSLPVEVTARLVTWNGAPAVMSICRDISRHMRFDKILLEAALEWQSTFDAMKDSVFLLSPEHRILRCNKASYVLFNKSLEGEMLGKFCWEVVHGTSEPLPACPIILMDKTKKRETAVLKTGERWLEVTVDPVFDENNNVSGAIHIVSDITDQKCAELELKRQRDHLEEMVEERTSELKESEKKYRELVENTNSIILKMDKTGKVTFFNEFAQSFFGFRAEEIIGKNVIGTIVPRKDVLGQNLRDMILEIGRHPGEFRNNFNENMRKDGERVWIAWTNKPVFDDDGDVVEIMCVGNDITGRVRAEKELEKYRSSLEELVWKRTEALKREKENLSKAQSIAHLGNWNKDMLTGELTWSDETRRIFGFGKDEEITYEKFMEHIHPEDVEKLKKAQSGALAGKEPINV
jgi:PAS domain S-box-containing protein